jgi:NTP-dependent ternary system trypsin peptidase co-occuring protein
MGEPRKEPELGIADLVTRVREELETLDTRRVQANRPVLFSVDEFELELQFTAVERKDGRGSIDLKVISLNGSKGVESSAVQKIRLKFVLEEEARRLRLLGSRAHARGYEEADSDTTPLDDFDDGGS